MPALKAVIDTSVMVSVAFAKQGLAKELKDMIAGEDFMLVTSKQILKELSQVLHYPRILKRFTPSENDINEFIGLIVEKALITEGLYRADGITKDPVDDMFVACALEAKADYIVARDPHLRNLKHFYGIQIVDVTTFNESAVQNRSRLPTSELVNSYKKSSCGQSGEICPNLPKCSIPRQKNNVDNKTRFSYQE